MVERVTMMLAAAAVLAAAALVPQSVRRRSAPAPVVMISIDGLRPDYVLDADQHGLRIPSLRRFVREGTYATGVRGVFPTVTYPSHITLLDHGARWIGSIQNTCSGTSTCRGAGVAKSDCYSHTSARLT